MLCSPEKESFSRDCRPRSSCSKCNGRHHTSICPRGVPTENSSVTTDLTKVSKAPTLSTTSASQGTTTNLHVGAQSPVLLQTAKVQLLNLHGDHKNPPIIARAVLDTGSQRTYVTQRVAHSLNLAKLRKESLFIKTFASTSTTTTKCDVVEFGLKTSDSEPLEIQSISGTINM